MGRIPAIASGLILACSLSACSGEEPAEERTLELGDQPSVDGGDEPEDDGGRNLPPGTPDPRPAPEQGQIVEQTDYGVYALELPANGAARAAAQAFVDYLDERTRTFNTGQEDLAALSSVAQGSALTSAQAYAADLRSRGARTVGDTWISIPADSVVVDGGSAELTGFCALNAGVDVDGEGRAVESPPDAYVIDAQVNRVGPGAWLVSSFTPEAVASC